MRSEQRFGGLGGLLRMMMDGRGKILATLLLVGLVAGGLVPQASAGTAGGESRPCGRIVFSSIAGGANIFRSVRPDGTDLRKLSSRNHGSFLISPDATTIAYSTFVPGSGTGNDIWLMDSDGNNVRRLTSTEAQSETDIAWAPDSRSIAVTREGGSPYPTVAVIDVSTGEAREVAGGREPDFSPEGSSIVLSAPSETSGGSSYDLFIADLDSGTTTPVTSDPTSDDRTPRWSPDGAWILFNRSPHDQSYEDDNAPFSDLWRVTPTGADQTKLTHIQSDGFGASVGAWSPNGELIAYNKVQTYDFNGFEYLTVISASGRDRTQHLLGATDLRGEQISWSPNGRQISFVRWRRGWDIWKHNLYSGTTKRLTRTEGYDSSPQWVSCPG